MDSIYIERYAWKECLFPGFSPDPGLNQIIVVPAFKEKHLLDALDSLNACLAPRCNVLILVVINESETADHEIQKINEATIQSLKTYDSKFELIFSYKKLPRKKSGVGLARKIGMDEAVRIFREIETDGIIICYDADCLCEPNYLQEIEKSFNDPRVRSGTVFYEHQLEGKHREEIIKYELYLRYYIGALRFANFPFAHQTLGSCIVVRSSTYQMQGGMNTRKAGEDFYFLNKVIPLDDFVEINSTTVFPSDRVSDRVPFGTGKAIGQLLEATGSYSVYNPKIFEDLKQFFDQVSNLYGSTVATNIPDSIATFLEGNLAEEVRKIREQTTTYESFYKRFFQWFDAFKILKFVHFCRDEHYPNIHLTEALNWLEKSLALTLKGNLEEKLLQLRHFDRKLD